MRNILYILGLLALSAYATLPDKMNLIGNSVSEFWQRGTPLTSLGYINHGVYGPDMFKLLTYSSEGASLVTAQQASDAPTGFGLTYSQDWLVTTAYTAANAASFAVIQYNVDAPDAVPYYGKAMTLSFWVKASQSGAHCISIGNASANRNLVMQYTVATSNTWQYVTLPFQLDPGNVSSWNTTEAAGNGTILVSWTLQVGSTLGAATAGSTTGAWGATKYYGTSACQAVNELGTIGNNFKITQIQLNEGSQPAPFIRYGGTQATDWSLVQRYYQTSFVNGTAPGVQANGQATFVVVGGSDGYGGVRFPVPMACNPTPIFWSPVTGTSNACYDLSALADITSSVGGNSTNVNGISSVHKSSGFTSGHVLACNWYAACGL